MRRSSVRIQKDRHDSATPFDYTEIFRVLFEKAWLIALCLVVAAFVVATIIIRTTPTYESKVVVQVEQSESKVLDTVQEVNPQDLRTPDLLGTIMENLKSRDVLGRVVKAVNLGEDKTFPEARDKILTEAELIDALEEAVETSIRKGTRLIDVKVEDHNPARATKIASTLVTEFIGQTVQSRAVASDTANTFLADNVQLLGRKVADAELALQRYKDERQAVSLEDKQNIVTEKLKDLNMRLTQAKSDRIRIETDLKQVTNFKNDPQKLVSIPSVAGQRAVGDLRSQVTAAGAELARIAQRYRPKHPIYVQNLDRYQELERRLNEITLVAAQSIDIGYQSAVATEQKVDAALREQEKVALDLEKIAIEYNALLRDVESSRALYNSMLKRQKETGITGSIDTTPLRVVESPTVPEYPSKPKKLRLWLIGMGAGLVVGIAAAFIMHSFDDTFRTVDQTEAFLDLPVIAALPMSSKFKTGSDSLVLLKNPDSPLAESFRILRSSLELMEDSGEKGNIVLFTSSVPSEGKSFSSANYAISSAQLGKRTLLIDADLRRPTIDELFFKGRKSVGLADILQGKVELEEALHVSNTENLFVLSAGRQCRNPAELLASTELREFLKKVSGQFDRVVLDTAPIHAVSDTLHLVSHCKFVCLVARSGKTPRKAVLRAAQLLEEAGRAPAGVVLNMLPARPGRGFYYSYYTGSYGKPVYGRSVASS